eukprot:m.215987 g.215987  ORF g.215987 m.215987 type:complete len:1013 (+) comp18649_c0_seq2:211-3249(+)
MLARAYGTPASMSLGDDATDGSAGLLVIPETPHGSQPASGSKRKGVGDDALKAPAARLFDGSSSDNGDSSDEDSEQARAAVAFAHRKNREASRQQSKHQHHGQTHKRRRVQQEQRRHPNGSDSASDASDASDDQHSPSTRGTGDTDSGERAAGAAAVADETSDEVQQRALQLYEIFPHENFETLMGLAEQHPSVEAACVHLMGDGESDGDSGDGVPDQKQVQQNGGVCSGRDVLLPTPPRRRRSSQRQQQQQQQDKGRRRLQRSRSESESESESETKDRSGVSAPVVIDSSPAPTPPPPSKRKRARAPSPEPIEVSSDSSDHDDGDYDNDSHPDVVTFFNTASAGELTQLRHCTAAKAKVIISRRPFRSYDEMVEAFERKPTVSYHVIEALEERIEEQSVVDDIMQECSKTSASLNKAIEETSAQGQALAEQPGNITSTLKLKPYQLVGLNWLCLLHKLNLNGILADEMGLGKTVQAISFLAHLVNEGEPGPHVVIVPASTLDNWVREFERWAPGVEVLQYYGNQSERAQLRASILRGYEDFDVLITTYTCAINSEDDRKLFRKLGCNAVVLDEGHMVKNIRSQRYHHLVKMKAARRILLTGTPIQNNLLELMSLLSFVVPSLFRGHTDVIVNMFGGSTKGSGKDRDKRTRKLVKQAQALIKPFVLRRLKDNVLTDLPPKVRRVEKCPMTPFQRAEYDRFVQNFKDESLRQTQQRADEKSRQKQRAAKIGKARAREEALLGFGSGAPNAKLQPPSAQRIQNILMHLRKAANHPLLLRCRYTDDQLNKMALALMKEPEYMDADFDCLVEDMSVMSDFELWQLCEQWAMLKPFRISLEKAIYDSGKVKQLATLLPDLIAKGRRVLLFSQFTTVMDLLGRFLDYEKLKFLRLDGSTPVSERQALLDRFNKEDDISVFLLSTKAGGLGINLTAANVVIIHDIDFNPHNDRQAEDRCHRMGQTKPVDVVRLIADDSVEEAMLQQAERKLQLEQDVGEQDSNPESLLALLKAALKVDA